MATWPLEKVGATGEDVKTVQYLLRASGATLTVDGGYGPVTKAAVEAFQGAHGLTVDGEVGNDTWPVLIVEVSSGSTGDAVKAVQSQITSRSGFLTVDGVFGPETDNAVRFFQADVGTLVDGVVGPLTWNPLVNGFMVCPDAVTAAQGLFTAWETADVDSAAKCATPDAVTGLFSHPFSAADGWTFAGSNGAAGHVGVEWTGTPGTLILLVNNDAGAPFFVVDNVIFP